MYMGSEELWRNIFSERAFQNHVHFWLIAVEQFQSIKFSSVLEQNSLLELETWFECLKQVYSALDDLSEGVKRGTHY